MSTTTRKPAPPRAAKKTVAPRKRATKSSASPANLNPEEVSIRPPRTVAESGAAPAVVQSPQSVILGPVMRKKELTDAVVARTGMKKKDVKPVVEQMLAVMGEALADNREMNLPPFGRLMVRKEKSLRNGRMVVSKIRQTTRAAEPGTDPDEDVSGK